MKEKRAALFVGYVRGSPRTCYMKTNTSIIRTADLKGHHERVMLILKDIYRIYRHTYHTTSHG